MQTNYSFDHYLAEFLLEWERYETHIVENVQTHILCSITFSSKILENILESERPQMTIWCMRIACWIPEATLTHSEYVIRIDFPLQQLLHGRTSVLRYTYIACLVI
jgi:hypothetical protein